MGKIHYADFGQLIRIWRRRLNLTQKEVARGINISSSYWSHLECNDRRPSKEIVARISRLMGSAPTLFYSANPEARELLREPHSQFTSSWESFSKNTQLRKLHRVTPEEMELLSSVTLLGEVLSERDFIYILNSVRQALGRDP
jgi:transcriptional regulator with XRE-family HTH domain